MGESRRMNHKQKTYQLIGIWMITLIVMLPLYSADALAVSVRITKNTGEAGVPGFIDGNGDNWQVEATLGEIGETDEVTSEKVFMRVAGSEQNFENCREDPSGVICEYSSDLSEGLPEDEFPFQVIYRFEDQAIRRSGTVKTENSAPEITGLKVNQASDGVIDISFNVKEEGDFQVGLAKVEIIDAESGTVLEEIANVEGKMELAYFGKISTIDSGEGVHRIKIRAIDLLGHSSESPAVPFRVDFIAPALEKINFTDTIFSLIVKIQRRS